MSEMSDWAQHLTERYPDPRQWPSFENSWKRDVFRFVRLWVTEGIPYAFRQKPMVFEIAREKIGHRLSVEPKCVGVSGSGSTGFSYAPSKFGTPYESGRSDLDLFIVSETQFSQTVADFQLFTDRFTSGREAPKTAAEGRYWPTNLRETPGTIRRGFIDQWRIPVKNEYTAARRLSSATSIFQAVVKRELGVEMHRMSVRVYRTWDNAVGQIGGSLLRALSRNIRREST